jgi:phage FluMu protein Com
MAVQRMRKIGEDEVPYDAGTAVQEHPGKPVFRGNGANDYVCVECGNLLATAMDPEFMGKRVRIRCGRCRTINISADVPVEVSHRRSPRDR